MTAVTLPAWTLRIDAITTDHVNLQVTVSYFDAAADPALATPLHTETFGFPPDTPAADIKTDIIGSGQGARNALAKRDALIAQFPVGTTAVVA